MYSDTGDTTSLVPGFPIRTSSDQRSVDSSPRHIAASHVLHRLLMPRHPPCALKHLQHKKTTRTKPADKKSANLAWMLATTIQLNKHHTPPPSGATTTTSPVQRPRTTPGVASGPNSVLAALPALDKPDTKVVVHQARIHY